MIQNQYRIHLVNLFNNTLVLVNTVKTIAEYVENSVCQMCLSHTVQITTS